MAKTPTSTRAAPAFAGEPADPIADDGDATVRTRILLVWMGLGASAGLPADELLAAAGLTPQQIGDPDSLVLISDADRLLRRVEQALPDQAISLRIVDLIPPSAFGLIDLGARSAATVGEAVDVYLRYTRLTTSHFQAWLERRDGLVAYRCRHTAQMEEARHPVEVAIGYSHRVVGRAADTSDALMEVHFGHAPVGPVAQYEAFFGCPVYFESFGHALVFRPELLERPMRRSDPVLSRSVVARLEAELPTSEDELGGLRRAIAGHAQAADYSASRIAKQMGRSLRSLQRDAAALGVTLRAIIEDVRVGRARELLRDDGLSVDEVGFLVGYSERAAFSRAFKRATGQTPAEYRRAGAK